MVRVPTPPGATKITIATFPTLPAPLVTMVVVRRTIPLTVHPHVALRPLRTATTLVLGPIAVGRTTMAMALRRAGRVRKAIPVGVQGVARRARHLTTLRHVRVQTVLIILETAVALREHTKAAQAITQAGATATRLTRHQPGQRTRHLAALIRLLPITAALAAGVA